MKIVGIYLAAGRSRRTGPGIHKLCLPMGNTLLGNIALNTSLSSNLSDVIIVSNEPSWFLKYIQVERVHILSSKKACLGQSYSLHCGLEKAESMNADGVIVMLADQPFITVKLLNSLIDSYEHLPQFDYVAASFQGIPQPPILFSKGIFPSLKKLKGDQGARSIFFDKSFQGKIIVYGDAKLFYDVDTIEDYNVIKNLLL
ncbi:MULTISPECIES: xanthine dehydrogenase accessory protein PucB [Bacillus]|uniref:xanthine dehydrogenase accessory protein PucB n=1 Tax=Bacillus TaxID=1386 RepID=UPI000B5DB21C|nr:MULTISPECIES: xanthine dehydrogenase accessory protein PucB [Bacillus]OXB98660.1 xanthine dehydrogenase accessory protein PucB [Bacillus sp. M13(2017)]QCY61780.1 xanthine dehydrogenase accessory protein PucB [Bacillus thuringiensis]